MEEISRIFLFLIFSFTWLIFIFLFLLLTAFGKLLSKGQIRVKLSAFSFGEFKYAFYFCDRNQIRESNG